jgi:hypothetical protein
VEKSTGENVHSYVKDRDMSDILNTVGKAAVVLAVAATHALGNTVSKACEVGADIGKATCDAAQGASQAAKIVADVVTKK